MACLSVNRQHGFSLLECLLGTALAGLLFGSASLFVLQQQQVVHQQAQQNQLFMEGQRLANWLTGQIRRSGYGYPESLSLPLPQHQESSLALGYLDEQGRYLRVMLRFDSSQRKLKLCSELSDEPRPVASTCEQNINFTFFDERVISVEQFKARLLSELIPLYRIEYVLRHKKTSQVRTFQLIVRPRNDT